MKNCRELHLYNEIYVSGFPFILSGFNGWYKKTSDDELIYKRTQQVYLGLIIRPTSIRRNKDYKYELFIDEEFKHVIAKSDSLLGNWSEINNIKIMVTSGKEKLSIMKYILLIIILICSIFLLYISSINL